MKLLGEIFHDAEVGNNFLAMIAQAQAPKEKIAKLNFIKILKLYI